MPHRHTTARWRGRLAQHGSHSGPRAGRASRRPQAGHSDGNTTASTGSTSSRAVVAARLNGGRPSQLSRLLLLLAGEAQAGPGHRLQALRILIWLDWPDVDLAEQS